MASRYSAAAFALAQVSRGVNVVHWTRPRTVGVRARISRNFIRTEQVKWTKAVKDGKVKVAP
jgi:hypothetical protein